MSKLVDEFRRLAFSPLTSSALSNSLANHVSTMFFRSSQVNLSSHNPRHILFQSTPTSVSFNSRLMHSDLPGIPASTVVPVTNPVIPENQPAPHQFKF